VYPLSSYSYMIIPTELESPLTEAKGRTLGAFGYYFLCQGQAQAQPLGFSPLPINLVQAGFDQLRRIPGAVAQSINIAGCHNPTFSTSGVNTLVKNAPFPQACDKDGPQQCSTGTAGAHNVSTPVKPGASTSGGGTGTGGGNGTNGGASGGGSSGGSTAGGVSGGGTAGTTASGGSSAAGGTAGGVDPDTGQATGDSTGSTGGAQDVAASSVAVGADSFWGLRTLLMGLSALLLLGVVIAPPTVTRWLTRTGRRDGRA
jgi:hypothetical protein